MAKPGGLRNFFGRVGDAFVWGKNYNPQTGQWSATPGQVMGGIGSRLLGVANPALGAALNMAGNRYYNGGGLFGRMGGSGPVSPQQIPVYNPGVSVGQLPIQTPGVTFNPNQSAQQPQPPRQTSPMPPKGGAMAAMQSPRVGYVQIAMQAPSEAEMWAQQRMTQISRPNGFYR